MLEIRIITKENCEDIRLPNEPFPLWGRMLPSYQQGQWDYTIQEDQQPSEMCFPDENYDFDEMSSNTVFLGAYDGENCVGLAIMQDHFLKYMYLYDLKVNRAYRRQGVSTKLMESAMKLAKQRGYRGIYTIGQDNNLSACLFYIHNGFQIGGLDTRVYTGTSQAGKADIYFYRDGE